MDIRTWKDADQADPSRNPDGTPYRPRHRSKRSPFSPLRPAPIAIGGVTTAAVAAIALLAPHLFNPAGAGSTRVDGLGSRIGPLTPNATSPGSSSAPTSGPSGSPSTSAPGSPASGANPGSNTTSNPTAADGTAAPSSASTPGTQPSAPTSTAGGSDSTPPQTSPTTGGQIGAPTPPPSTGPTTGVSPVAPTPPPTTTVPPPTSTTPPSPPPTTTPPIAAFNASAAQAQALSEIATARQNAGRGSLHVDNSLASVASKHTADMVTHGLFSHTGSNGSSPWDRAVQDAGCWNWYQEVIARGMPGDDVVGALLNDPNSGPVLKQWGLQTIGVSAQQDPKTGQVLWTIELGWA